MQTSSKRAEICYFDRRYSVARQGINFNDTDNPTLKLVTATRYKNDRKYAHAAPVSKASVHKAIKEKAMLASVACLTAAMIGLHRAQVHFPYCRQKRKRLYKVPSLRDTLMLTILQMNFQA